MTNPEVIVRLQNQNQKNADVRLNSGKTIKSDGSGNIEVPEGADAQALINAGDWNRVDEHGNRIGTPAEVRAAARAPKAEPAKEAVKEAEEPAPAKRTSSHRR